ncbi:hypothetical protein IWQ56_003890, partial [Coemansia nantahalensis]
PPRRYSPTSRLLLLRTPSSCSRWPTPMPPSSARPTRLPRPRSPRPSTWRTPAPAWSRRSPLPSTSLTPAGRKNTSSATVCALSKIPYLGWSSSALPPRTRSQPPPAPSRPRHRLLTRPRTGRTASPAPSRLPAASRHSSRPARPSARTHSRTRWPLPMPPPALRRSAPPISRRRSSRSAATCAGAGSPSFAASTGSRLICSWILPTRPTSTFLISTRSARRSASPS